MRDDKSIAFTRATAIGVMTLSDDQLSRYARQILLPEVGEAGQERLRAARVLVVGAGGLGVPVASYLAAAGIGTVGLADGDTIARSNLPRQIAYAEIDIGASKTARLAQRLRANNPETQVIEHPRLEAGNIDAVVGAYDLVADGCDNFPTRYLVNAACVRARRVLVSAALSRFTGELGVFVPDGPCYQCLFPKKPNQEQTQGCVDGGILGPMAGLLGCWQALEMLKQILEMPGRLRAELLVYDAYIYLHRRIELSYHSGCPVCVNPSSGESHAANPVFRSIA